MPATLIVQPNNPQEGILLSRVQRTYLPDGADVRFMNDPQLRATAFAVWPNPVKRPRQVRRFVYAGDGKSAAVLGSELADIRRCVRRNLTRRGITVITPSTDPRFFWMVPHTDPTYAVTVDAS